MAITYNILNYNGKEYWWRKYGNRWGSWVEVILNPKKYPTYTAIKSPLYLYIIWEYENFLDLIKHLIDKGE